MTLTPVGQHRIHDGLDADFSAYGVRLGRDDVPYRDNCETKRDIGRVIANTVTRGESTTLNERGGAMRDKAGERQSGQQGDDGTPIALGTLLRAREVARILDVKHKRVYALVGDIAVRYGPRTLRWRPTDIHKWIEARRGRE